MDYRDIQDMKEQTDVAQYDSILFDLDDTLYPLSTGLAAACRRNIEAYMFEKLGIPIEVVPDMCTRLYKSHGTTMAGLWAEGYDFDHDDFHRFVHGRLPYELLRPDPVLRNLILSMPQRKYIFTNADEIHAAIALQKLGLEDCFEAVICFESFNRHSAVSKDKIQSGQNGKPNVRVPILCKPLIECMERAVELVQVDPARTIYFDDSSRNIVAGKAIGLHTVLVGSLMKFEGADYCMASIHNVKEAIPEIWAEPHYFEELRLPPQKVAIETLA